MSLEFDSEANGMSKGAGHQTVKLMLCRSHYHLQHTTKAGKGGGPRDQDCHLV